MAHQDWNPVVIHKKPPSSAELRDPKVLAEAIRSGRNVHTEHRPRHDGGKAARVEKKAEAGEGDFRHAHVPTEIRSRIVRHRTAKHMTQAQLAQAVNLPQRVVQEYENGKAIPDAATLNRLARALGVASLRK